MRVLTSFYRTQGDSLITKIIEAPTKESAESKIRKEFPTAIIKKVNVIETGQSGLYSRSSLLNHNL